MLMSAPVVGWVVCGMVASVMATGRQWVVMVSTVVPAAVGFLVIALPTFFGAWGERIAVILGIIFLPGLAFFGTIVLFILAFRQQLIENNVAVKCGAIAVAFIALIAVFVRADLYQTLVFSSAGCLVVTPIAAFPLAVAWNRHR